MAQLAALSDRLEDQIPGLARQALVPGVLIGVSHQGQELRLAHGVANVTTGAPMTTDTAWLLGSITKVLTATLVLRFVERGHVDLDARVVTYLPDLELADRAATQQLTLRQLLNHTNGIDADTLMPPSPTAATAVKSYVDALADCGTLFEPGELVHYSNPGFCIAGRILEVVAGTPFNQLLESEIYDPAGMQGACTSAKQAILGRVARGSLPDRSQAKARPTTMFQLPASAAPAGATPIVTLDDILDFARLHLRGGVAADGTRVLSDEHIQAMQTVTKDMATPNVPPIGLGWWIVPLGATTALWHGGGSPGGASSLVVVPEHDLVVASFGNGAGAAPLHDAIVATVLDELTGAAPALPQDLADAPRRPWRYEGIYAGFQVRHHVRHDGDGLSVTPELLPVDEHHERLAAAYLGEAATPPALKLKPVGGALFAAADAPPAITAGIWGRTTMASFHAPAADARPEYLHQGLRLARRQHDRT